MAASGPGTPLVGYVISRARSLLGKFWVVLWDEVRISVLVEFEFHRGGVENTAIHEVCFIGVEEEI